MAMEICDSWESINDSFGTRPSWFDITREEELTIERIKKEELRDSEGGKLFVGGFDFEGLTSEEECLLRLDVLFSCFMHFGDIVRTKINMEKKYGFIVFAEVASAARALKKLSIFEVRTRFITRARYNLELDGISPELAPKSNFYVRWPKKTKEGKKEKLFREKRNNMMTAKRDKKNKKKDNQKTSDSIGSSSSTMTTPHSSSASTPSLQIDAPKTNKKKQDRRRKLATKTSSSREVAVGTSAPVLSSSPLNSTQNNDLTAA